MSTDARKEFIRSSIAAAVLAAPGGALRAKDFLSDLGNAVATAACVDTFLDTPGYVGGWVHLGLLALPVLCV